MYSTKEQEDDDLKFISYTDLQFENNLRSFEGLSSVVFFIGDLARSQVLFVSDSSKDILGHNPTELTQKGFDTFISLIHPGDFPILLNQYAAILSNLKSSFMYEKTLCFKSQFRLCHAKGHWVRLQADLILMNFDTDRNPLKVFGNLKTRSDKSQASPFFVDKVREGDKEPMSDRPLQIHLKEPPCNKVSHRELQVLRLIGSGYSAKQIADKLYISEHTAINHRKNLIEKFNVKNTAELIRDASKIYWL